MSISKSNLLTTTPSANDPVIQVSIDHPQNVAVPSAGEASSPVYSGTVTLKNISNLPLNSSLIQLTLKDHILGYDAALVNSDLQPVAVLTLELGAIPAGKSASAPYKFRINRNVDTPPPPQSSDWVQLNVLPGYEIKYAQVDGFSSTARAEAAANQSPPGGCSDRKTDSFTSDPIIEVDHSYWGYLREPLQGGGYVGGNVTVKNKAQVPLSKVTLQFELDDDGARWTAVTLDAYGNTVRQTNFDLGALAPDAAPAEHKYWWNIQHIGGTTLQPEVLNVDFNIMPWYQVQYQRDDETFKIRMGVTAS